MKKLSILVLICMLMSCVLMACDEAVENVGSTVTTEAAHTHAYGSDWLYSATEHYHICGCGEKSGAAAHADENNDGACDVCAATMSGGHVFDKAWTADETGHWHADLCGHDVTDGKAAHTAGKIGLCTVCGYKVSDPQMSNITEALAVATFTQGAVKNGILTQTSISEYNTYSMYKWYEYGDKYLHVLDTDSQTNYYATLNDDGTVFYMTVSNDPITPVMVDKNADETYMAGPMVDLGNVLRGESIPFYGAISMIEYLYEIDEKVAATDFAEKVENGVYSFSYTGAFSMYGQQTDMKIAVSFKFAPDTYIMDEATIAITDGGYTTEFKFTQTVDVVNNHKPEMMIPVSYEIADPKGNVLTFTEGKSAKVDVVIGTNVFKFIEIDPATALIDILGVSAVFVDGEGNETYGDGYASYKNGAVTVKMFKAGDFTLKITVGETEYLIPVKSDYAKPTALTINTYNDLYQEFTPANTYSMYKNASVIISASVADGCEPNKYVATVTGANAADGVLVDYTINSADGDIKGYTFTSAVAGTYTVEFVSEVDATVKATMTITVNEPPTANEIAVGKHQGNGATVNFYPADAANTSGIAIADVSSYMGAATITFTYEIVEGVFTAIPEAPYTAKQARLTITADYKVSTYYSYMTTTLDYVGEADPMTGGDGGSQGGNLLTSGHSFSENDTDGGTFSIKIAANSTAKINFAAQSYDPIPSFAITVDWENANVTAQTQIDMVSADLTNGGVVNFNNDDWNIDVVFTNTTAEEITLEFTLTWANA